MVRKVLEIKQKRHTTCQTFVTSQKRLGMCAYWRKSIKYEIRYNYNIVTALYDAEKFVVCLSIYAIICHSCTVCIKISILWDYFHYSQLLVVLNSFFRVNIFQTNEFPLRCWGKQRLTECVALTCIFYLNLSLNIATKAISYIEAIWQLVRLK